ncbi:MAG: glycosyltransferase family 4 protein [Phycisphaerae bacterium]|jgi:glycosyltransferase involved in cell wall biosynthesis
MMRYPRKVLIGLPTGVHGGVEIQTKTLVKVLVAGGYHVTVCCYYEYNPQMLRSIEEVGADVCTLDLPRRGGLKHLTEPFRFAPAWRQVIRREQPWYCHVQLEHSLLPLVLARACRVPCVLATAHTMANRFHRKTWSVRHVAPWFCDAFLCVSQTAEKSFFGTSALWDAQLYRQGQWHFTLPNGLDLAEIQTIQSQASPQALRHPLGLEGRKIIGIIGRHRRAKGHQFLFEAIPEILKHEPRAKVLVIGSGSHGQSLRDLAARSGAAESILWLGELPHGQALEWMTVMDVVVMPSRSEACCLSAAEAMALGKPLVASDVEGLRELLAGGQFGLLVPFGDSQAIASAVIQLLQDTSLRQRLAAAGQEHIRRFHSLELYAARILELYHLWDPQGG